MSEVTEEDLKLIRKGRSKFINLAAAYFLGVFNDNFFKQAALFIAIALGDAAFQGFATILFALPFVLFAAPAGWVADKFSKRDVAFYCKILEVLAMLAGGYGIYTMQLNWILVMLFIMAAQSTLFSPALNGSLPELYPEFYITKANSIVKLVSTGAILLGIFCAGKVMDIKGDSQKVEPFLKVESILKPTRFLEKVSEGKTDLDVFLKQHMPVNELMSTKDNVQQKIFEQLVSVSKSNDLRNYLGFEGELNSRYLFSFLKIDQGEVNSSSFVQFFNLFENAQIERQQDKFRDLLLRSYNLEIQFKVLWTLGITIVSILVIAIALLGVFFAYFIKKFPAAAPDKPFPWLGPLDTLLLVLPKVYKDYLLRLTFIGFFFFYTIASLLTLIINQYGLTQLGLSYGMTSYLVLALLLGICTGSIVAGIKLSGKDWYEKMPLALFILGLFLAAFYFIPLLPDNVRVYMSFVFLFFAGAGGGMFVIPSESFQQTRPDIREKGEVISAGNFVVFIGVLLSGYLFNLVVVDFEVLPSKAIFGMGLIIVLLSALGFIAVKSVSPTEKE